MAATLIEADDLQFGVKEDEDGLVIESFTVAFNQQEKEVRSKQGEVIALALYNKTEDITVSGLLKGTGDLATLALGAEADLANTINGRGITAGMVILKSATHTETQEDFKKAELRLTRYPLIAATGP